MIRKHLIMFMFFCLISSSFLFSAETFNKVLAVVNDEIITLYDYNQRKDELYKALSQRYKGEELTKKFIEEEKDLLESMIEGKLIISEAKKLDIEVEKDLELHMENIKKQYDFKDNAELRKAIEERGMKFSDWKKNMKQYIMRQRLIQKKIGDKAKVENNEMTEYYSNNKNKFKIPAEYEVLAIYLKEVDITGDIEDIKKKIEADLQSDNFSEIAQKYSSEPLKSNKGKLGKLKENELDPALLEELKNMTEGKVSNWIKYKEGWMKLKLENKKEFKIRPFKDVQENIRRELVQKKREKYFNEYLEELKKKAFIKKYTDKK